MPIALIVVLLLGGGTSAIAETSLPGDLLYQVKVNVNENVRSILAVSADAQARWDARRAERRIEEAENLIEKNKLDDKKAVEIEARLDAQVKKFENGILKLSEKNRHSSAAEINSNFGASLKAHQDILVKLEQNNASLSARIRPIFMKLSSYSSANEESRVRIESELSASTGPEVQAAAEGKMKAAQNKIDEVVKFLERQKSSVSAEVYASASAKLDVAKQAVVEGNTYLSAKNYSSAFSSFQRASHLAQESKLALTENTNLDLKVNINIGGDGRNEEEMKKEAEEINGDNSGVDVRGEVDVKSEGQTTETRGGIKVELGL